ncbi:MAG: chloride channel protein, partial [Vampirovibrionia bacterium]
MVRLIKYPHISDDFKRYLRKHLSVKQQTLVIAVVIGMLAGVLGFAFKFSIASLGSFFQNFAGSPENWWEWFYYPVIGFIGGSIAGLIVQFVPESSGSGIPEVRLAIFKLGKSLKRRNIVAKFFGGVAGIGCGLSMGREGPTVQIGASCGAFVSKLFGIIGKRQKKFLAAGAGAGLSAAFNTPIAGVLFVVEELSQNFTTQFLAPCIVASVTASAVVRYLSGNNPSYSVPIIPYDFSLYQLPLFIVLGVSAGVLGTVFIRSIIFSLDCFASMKIPVFLKAGLAGLITGMVAIWMPQVIGDGHHPIEALLSSYTVLWFLPLIFFFKLLLTSLAYGSGAPGGLFAPSLLCGAALGLFFGEVSDFLFPTLDLAVGNVALVGMAAFFTAVVRTPITAAVIIFELTGNYHMILPLMICCIIADLFSAKLFPRAIYPALLFRSTGIDLDADKNQSPLEEFRVGDVMTSKVDSLSLTTTLAEALEMSERSHHNGFPVLSDNNN